MKTVVNILALVIILGGTPSGVGPHEAFAAEPQEKKKAHETLALADGILVDPVEKAIFVANSEGGIEALDLATGKTLWRTAKEDGQRWPVAVYGRTLVVRVRDNPLRIAGLDLDARGKTLWVTEPVLPDWVKGPEWADEKPRRQSVVPESVPADQKAKPNREERELDLLKAALVKVRGTYVCEERIEKGELVTRWQATGDPLDARKEASGIVVVDLETGKVRSRPLEKDRKVEANTLPQVEVNGIVFSVEERKHVGNWVKTLPASRGITHARTLIAVDKKTGKLVWKHTLWEWGYKETRPVNGG